MILTSVFIVSFSNLGQMLSQHTSELLAADYCASVTLHVPMVTKLSFLTVNRNFSPYLHAIYLFIYFYSKNFCRADACPQSAG